MWLCLDTLIKSRYGCILRGNISPRIDCVRYKIGKVDFVGLVINRMPIGDRTHAFVAVAKLLAKLSVLGVRVAASVRVVECHVQKERPKSDPIRYLLIYMTAVFLGKLKLSFFFYFFTL